MIARLRPAAIPAYLLLCLLVGGSTQGVWGNAVLQLLAIAILAWAALSRDSVGLPAEGKRLWILVGAWLVLLLIQLVSLPPALWTQLPGRDFVAEGYRLLGMELPWLPISLAPHDTLAAALMLLPPIAVLAGITRLGAFRQDWLVLALLLGALASVILGVLQVTTGNPDWYLYRFSNFGAAAGLFANSNHMGALLLASVPFLGAYTVHAWRKAGNAHVRSLIAALAAGGAALLGVGILVNSSLAVLMLGLPAAAATAIMIMRLRHDRLRRSLALVALLLVAGAAVIGLVGRDNIGDRSASIETRVAFWSGTADAIGDHWLAGTGIATFEPVYRRYEDPATVGRTFVNHAHNDYLEVALEAGVLGIVLVLLFLAWWLKAAASAWRSSSATDYARAASIASATLLLHSLVDFPLRTAAMGATMAMCLALLAGARRALRDEGQNEVRPARHVTL